MPWQLRLVGLLVLNAVLGCAVYTEAAVAGMIGLPEHPEINLATGEIRRVIEIGPLLYVKARQPGTDFYRRYIGSEPAPQWQPLGGEADVVSALARMVDDNRLFGSGPRGKSLTAAAKPELIRSTLQLLHTSVGAASQYLCTVYGESLRRRLPMGMRDLPDPGSFLIRFRYEFGSLQHFNAGCSEFYRES